MANVVITKELGYIKVDFGSYFPATTLEKTHYFPFSGWQGVCTVRVGAVDGIEFHVAHESDSFKFDAVFCLEVFEYVWNPVEAFKNLWRLMNNDSVAYVSFPAIYCLPFRAVLLILSLPPSHRNCLDT